MIFNKKSSIRIPYSEKSLKYFQQMDTLLQLIQFEDGRFSGVFSYFRNPFFELIDREMKGMSRAKKIEFQSSMNDYKVETLAVLSRAIKQNVFEEYIDGMYPIKKQNEIREKISDYPSKIPTARIKKT